jgi:DNA replication protein DnaC
MSARKNGPPTTFDEVAERARQRMDATTKDEAEREREWNRWTAKKKAEASADLRRAQRQALREMDLPIDALELIEAGVTSTMALEAVVAPADILVLAGGVGTGKTVAAVSWLYAWVQDARNWQSGDAGPHLVGRAVFLTAPALQRGPRFDGKWVGTLSRASRLVLDDLGSEYDPQGAFASLVEELVSERYARRRPTLITTNTDADTFKRRYGARITDRIRERGRFESVGSKSMRGKK